jgi:lipid-binding SYLF domain-containing protein
MAKSKEAESKRGKQNARPTNKSPIHKEVAATLKRLEKQDPGLKKFLDDAYGYAVFPSVGKAAVVVGGAYGRGVVFEQGEPIGFATMGQLTLGVQLGGDTFSEVIAFESKETLDRFKKGRMAFAANASAVLVKAGAASTTNFEKGVATFVYAEGGMMLELAIGGQRFKFKSAEEGEEGEEDEGGEGGAEQGEGSGMTGLAGRAVGGAKQLLGGAGRVVGAKQLLGGAKRVAGGAGSAASKAKELAKGHPVAAALVGTGVAAGAVMAVRALRGASGAKASGAKASGGEKGGTEQRRRPGAEEDGSVGGGGKRDAGEERPSSRQQKQGGGSSRGGSAGRGQASRARR